MGVCVHVYTSAYVFICMQCVLEIVYGTYNKELDLLHIFQESCIKGVFLGILTNLYHLANIKGSAYFSLVHFTFPKLA